MSEVAEWAYLPKVKDYVDLVAHGGLMLLTD